MCARYTLAILIFDRLAEILGARVLPGHAELARAQGPRYNIAPTQRTWIVERDGDQARGGRLLVPARWGLVNRWAKDRSWAARQINARAEGLATSRAYRDAYAKRRAVVPADGFYEWTGPKGHRTPFRFRMPDGSLLLMAGLHEDWRDPETKETLHTFSVVTCAASPAIARFHDRMPLLLTEDVVDDWMACASDADAGRLAREVAPRVAERLTPVEVSTRVNAVANDDPSLIEPAAAAPMVESKATKSRGTKRVKDEGQGELF